MLTGPMIGMCHAELAEMPEIKAKIIDPTTNTRKAISATPSRPWPTTHVSAKFHSIAHSGNVDDIKCRVLY